MHGLCIRDTPYSYKNPPILNANNAIGGDKKKLKKCFLTRLKVTAFFGMLKPKAQLVSSVSSGKSMEKIAAPHSVETLRCGKRSSRKTQW